MSCNMSATRLNKATNNSGQMRLGVAVATASSAVEAQGPFTPPPPRQNWRELNRRVNSVQLCGHLADMSSSTGQLADNDGQVAD